MLAVVVSPELTAKQRALAELWREIRCYLQFIEIAREGT